MENILRLLITSAALAGAIGGPARSAVLMSTDGDDRPVAAIFNAAPQTMPLVRASGDDDDDDNGGRREGSLRAHDEDDDDCGAEDDDEGICIGGAGNPAPAGTVAPPRNGLFGNGSAPQVTVN